VFVDDPAAPVLDGADAHHLARVLRLRDGEIVVAADGRGSWAPAVYRSRGQGEAALELQGRPRREPAPTPALTVAFAPTKGDRPEWVVQKLTELGVDRIVLLAAERAVVRWEGDRVPRALERLRRVAREAAAQARRVWLPQVDPPLALAEAASGGALALARGDGGPPGLEPPGLAVGPEGGWSPAELALDLPAVALGPLVLRAETAAVAAGVLLAALRAGTVAGARRGQPGPGGEEQPGMPR
jgi:16S rRNA (uracil1498-N3)-methyltransferase